MRVLFVAATAVALFASACSNPDDANSTSVPVKDTASDAREVLLLEDYVRDLAAGDFAAANSLRCAALQLSDSEVETRLGPAVAKIREDLGALALDSAEVVRRSVDPSDDASVPEAVVAVRLVGAESDVLVGVTSEEGAMRVCHQTLAGADEVLTRGPKEYLEVSTSMSIADLDLLEPPPGFARMPSDVTPGLVADMPGYIGTGSVQWTGLPGGAVVRIAAHQFTSAMSALDAQHSIEQLFAGNVTDVIPVSGPASRAFRYLGAFAVGIQPAHAGPQVDAATIRFSQVLFTVSVSPLKVTEDHSIMLSVSRSLLLAALDGQAFTDASASARV